MGRFLGITVKRGIPCRCLDGHFKEPYEMSMAWEPDRMFNFFFGPPAHLCAITYVTEISLNVMLNNHIHSLRKIPLILSLRSLSPLQIDILNSNLVHRIVMGIRRMC